LEKKKIDQKFMQRALELAKKGRGSVSPNPLVGCVLTYENKIIGEGWHHNYGEGHAEVNAVADVFRNKKAKLLEQATAYVTLEPCSHYGKTPPCADLLIKHKIKRLVVASVDSNPLVGGKGLAKFREAGIEVEIGVLNEENRKLNAAFFTFIEKKRPYILLKWAETADGFVARKNFDSKWISNPLSRTYVHKYRSQCDAIIVGTNTAQYDNPKLTTRNWSGKNPLRIVLDTSLRLDKKLHLFDDILPTICYNFIKSERKNNTEYIKINSQNVIPQILNDLYQRKIQSLLVEGGAGLLQHFLAADLWDKALIFKSKSSFGEGISAPSIKGELVDNQLVRGDCLQTYVPLITS
jgi:diaminohydroxyphosphoribosylaminopyrimidine deaminase/5-amino-6-(5-phosphoribosylamino)uracil reductase